MAGEGPVTISVIAASELTEDLCRKWRQIQEADPDLASPYFAPEFSAAVGLVRPDARVAIIEDGGKIGFFPFQRGKFGIGKPIGGLLSDYHGLIASKDLAVDVAGLLRACQLVAWDFNHLPLSQTVFQGGCRQETSSPVMDLSHGYEAYVSERRAAGTEQIKKCGNLIRRVEKELGALRFVEHSPDPDVLKTCLRLKTEQYLRTGKRDLFAVAWIRELLARIHQLRSTNFAGMLSALYAGEQLMAVHFGMRHRAVWHYWFPAYHEEFAKYSPGLLLLLKMAEHAPGMGVSAIDLGQGASFYKQRLMNRSVPLGVGSVERCTPVTLTRTSFRSLKRLVRRTPLAAPVRRVLDVMRLRNRASVE